MQVEQSLANYRTLLIELLVKIRIKSPASLHNKTIGEMFAAINWEKKGPEINSMLMEGEHNSLCLAHGRKPIIPYQPFSPPQFKHLTKESDSCAGGRRSPAPGTPSYYDLLSVSPLRSSSTVFSLSRPSLVLISLSLLSSFRSIIN